MGVVFGTCERLKPLKQKITINHNEQYADVRKKKQIKQKSQIPDTTMNQLKH